MASLFFVCGLLLTGCATDGPGAPGMSRPSAPASPASRYNLTGYSAGFKEGYTDACASPQRRSDQRYKSDGDYQMGWNDGRSLCRK